jgi:lipoprotein-anchoring transpeptidase ErfK/SrfK
VLIPVVARTSPAAKAAKTADVQPVTRYSQEPTTLLVQNMKVETNGRVSWVEVQLPGRPNGHTGWIPRSAVLLDQTKSRIKIRLKSRVVETYTSGKLTGSYKAAVGTGGTPTPTGNFAIDDPYRTKTASERGTYGPYILTLTAYSNVLKNFGGGPGTVAIHGWPDASVLGKAASHGCIRVANGSVAAIARIAKSGTPVDIVDD